MSTTLTLPDELAETYAEIARRDGRTLEDVVRTALETYAERAAELRVNGDDGRSSSSWIGTTGSPATAKSLDPHDNPTGGGRRFESLGAGESPDDGYDSTNHEEWLKTYWTPD